MATLTVSGNEQTDATRTLSTQGDGITAPDSSTGVWKAATNLVTNGGVETNTTGFSTFGAFGQDWARITSDQKFGTACLELTRITNGAGQEGVQTASFAVSASTQYTASIWVKAVSGNPANISLFASDGTNFPTVTATGATLGAWTRYSVTWTTAGGATTAFLAAISTNGSAGDKFRADGWQLESGPIATPYIETNGATATRAACRVQAPANVLNATQGWAIIRFRAEAGTAAIGATLLEWHDGPYSNAIELYRFGGSTWQFDRSGSGSGTNIQTTQTPVAGTIYSFAVAWTATTISSSFNGAAYTNAANTTIPAAGTLPALLDIGNDGGGSQINGELLWAAFGTGTAPDPTQSFLLSNTDPTLGQFTQANDCRAVMPFNTTAYDAASGQLSGTLAIVKELNGTAALQ